MTPGVVIPFPGPTQRTAAYVLEVSARWRRPTAQAVPPESLGNMLQRLAGKRPAAIFVLEKLVADMLKRVDP